MAADGALSSSRLRCGTSCPAPIGTPACLETCAVAVRDGRDDRLVSPAAVEEANSLELIASVPRAKCPRIRAGLAMTVRSQDVTGARLEE